jgi:protein tyrosine/serine phosphatase
MTRHIDFDGIDNFRDFGGYATACGRSLKSGQLFRSANHHRATEADLKRLRDLGVSVVVDLRQPKERQREPSRRWDDFSAAVIENDLVSEHPDWTFTLQHGDLTPQWFLDDAVAYYRRAPHEPRHVDLFARYFQALAASDGPLVVHCAAGKDRTGLICALTHHIAGVHPDDALADYLLTNDETRMKRKMSFLGPWLQETVGRTPSDDALRVAVSVHSSYLEAAFAVITEAHGSIDGYLEEVLGVGPALREQIHERVLA